MIWTYLILFLLSAFTQLLTILHLQPVTALPQVLGIDIDGTMVNGVSLAHNFFTLFWPIGDMLIGTLVIVGYLILKNIALRTFLGHRTPGR
jgi:hypothetical protein